MSVGTGSRPPVVPASENRDLRDPALLGWALLTAADGAPLSEAYDRDRWRLERLPAWSGDGLMSNDPSTHHSKTPQTPHQGGKQ